MRYSPGHKEQTRARMVETAARVLRRDGIDAAGLAGLMEEAGLTQGAFYAHFPSKEALVAEAVVSALGQTRAAMAEKVGAAAPEQKLEAVIGHYLIAEHVAHPEHGCAVAALGSELGRRPEATRKLVDEAVSDLITLIADALPPGHPDPVATARSIFAVMAGTIQLARASDPAVVPEILAAGTVAARRLSDAPIISRTPR